MAALAAALDSVVRGGLDLRVSYARHGVVALRCPLRSLAVLKVCEAAACGGRLAVHAVGGERASVRAHNLLFRAAASSETLLLLVDFGTLEQLLNMGANDNLSSIAYLVEYDQLPNALQLVAQSQSHLSMIRLRPSSNGNTDGANDIRVRPDDPDARNSGTEDSGGGAGSSCSS